MNSAVNSQTKIKVNMFGEFSISINKHTATNLKGKTKRVWLLIQYLIVNRHRYVSTDEIIENIWPKGACKDPLNALKNLVYRAREILKKISGNKHAEYIQYINNSYRWNNSFNCIIDNEKFEKFLKCANDTSKSASVRIKAYKNAFQLYKGSFLPKSNYSTWVVMLRTEYEQMYIDAVLKVCELLYSTYKNLEAIEICKNALKIFPLDENIHKMLLYSYIYTGQRSEAIEHYNYVLDLFYKEFGIDISESLESVYKKMTHNIQNIEVDLNTIKKDLKEVSNISEAYFCDYEIFKAIYRVHSRLIERTGNVMFIILFTICDLNGLIANTDDVALAAEKLKSTIIHNLRKSDVVTAYSATQFIVMLPMINYENAEAVTKRVLKKFHYRYRHDDIKIQTRISELY